MTNRNDAQMVRRVRAGGPPPQDLPPVTSAKPGLTLDEVGHWLAWAAMCAGAAVCVAVIAGVIAGASV